MHGLILKTFQVFVQDTYGTEAWTSVAQAADLEFAEFEAMLSYAPDVYDTLISTTEQVMHKPREVFLEDVGTYLVSHPNSEGLRRLLRFGGVDYIEFLHSLDDLPDRARLVVADLPLPDLQLHDDGQNQFRLVVGAGLAGFGYVMVGVLRALADDYGALVMLDTAPPHDSGHQVVDISLFETAFSEGREFALASGGEESR